MAMYSPAMHTTSHAIERDMPFVCCLSLRVVLPWLKVAQPEYLEPVVHLDISFYLYPVVYAGSSAGYLVPLSSDVLALLVREIS
jgi:hypothetical protein